MILSRTSFSRLNSFLESSELQQLQYSRTSKPPQSFTASHSYQKREVVEYQYSFIISALIVINSNDLSVYFETFAESAVIKLLERHLLNVSPERAELLKDDLASVKRIGSGVFHTAVDILMLLRQLRKRQSLSLQTLYVALDGCQDFKCLKSTKSRVYRTHSSLQRLISQRLTKRQ